MSTDGRNVLTQEAADSQVSPTGDRDPGIGPPRWGSTRFIGTGTQADGLGFHRAATLWRKRSVASHALGLSESMRSLVPESMTVI